MCFRSLLFLNVRCIPAAAAVLCLVSAPGWAAGEKRNFTDLQGRVLRASLEKISGDDIVVKKSVDGMLVTLKAGQLSDEDILYLVRQGFDQGALQNSPRNAPGSVPDTAEGLRASLENTLWDWVNADDKVQVGGTTVLKQGAWQAVRFRPGGMMSAWHKDKIVWEGRWEVVAPRTVRVAVRDAVGLVLTFNTDANHFTVANERDTQGDRRGRAPVPEPFVGTWRWKDGFMATIREDGTVNSDGTWKRVQRYRNDTYSYELHWGTGERFDYFTVRQDRKQMHGRNHLGTELSAERVVERP
ncbi:hypothetical protein [Prosthecobacter vanneervenii]|uniref:SLA1 homology domain-containing protein n=1 Tax=Prosthecobacter vanneervenii TaxID=48466 RepID=A0A7W8DLJ5_9BACT|nr:hypothetical protein [Prosthecobacter vanneervenii]MBB5034217.1 hypothetical protein [Prosthecobacter vanneervenii]